MGSRRGRQHPGVGEGSQAPHPQPAGRGGRGGSHQGRGGGRQSRPDEAQQQQPRGHARGGTRDHPHPARAAAPSSTGSASPLAPELRQAMEAPHELAQTSPMQPGPSQSSPEIDPGEEHKPVEASAGHGIVPAIPSSSKSVRFPLRPGNGSLGTKCLVKANHFFTELPDKDLHHYDVR